MEQLTGGLAALDIAEGGEDYREAVTDILHEARKVREGIKGINSDEIDITEVDITEKLAQPFALGGLLIILERPRKDHPWSKGWDAVIEHCSSLAILQEGLSKYDFSLMQDVSLLDWFPYLYCKKMTSATMEDKVLKAIEAKQPDCILCMTSVCLLLF